MTLLVTVLQCSWNTFHYLFHYLLYLGKSIMCKGNSFVLAVSHVHIQHRITQGFWKRPTWVYAPVSASAKATLTSQPLMGVVWGGNASLANRVTRVLLTLPKASSIQFSAGKLNKHNKFSYFYQNYELQHFPVKAMVIQNKNTCFYITFSLIFIQPFKLTADINLAW